jgi:hypothetical protein
VFTSTLKKHCKEFKYTLDPKNEAVKKFKFLDLWKERKLTTFQYLMWVNYSSGRSYNDLSQYHVFPWILDASALPCNPNSHHHGDEN